MFLLVEGRRAGEMYVLRDDLAGDTFQFAGMRSFFLQRRR
jgi:hypothetical protein